MDSPLKLFSARKPRLIHERASGPNHPWTRDSAAVTADALDALGRADEAAAVRARYGLGGGSAA